MSSNTYLMIDKPTLQGESDEGVSPLQEDDTRQCDRLRWVRPVAARFAVHGWPAATTTTWHEGQRGLVDAQARPSRRIDRERRPECFF